MINVFFPFSPAKENREKNLEIRVKVHKVHTHGSRSHAETVPNDPGASPIVPKTSVFELQAECPL